MKTIEEVENKIKEGGRITTLKHEIEQLKLDIDKIDITSKVDKTILRITDFNGVSNSVTVQFYATELQDILKSKLKAKEELIQKLIKEF